MIPKIIHYCWFGNGEMPELVKRCIESWHEYMSEGEWQYRLWTEDNFDIGSAPLYVRQAYEAKKYAFVSDYVRLWALEKFGGVYLDTDVEIIKAFDPLMDDDGFIGFEESKAKTLGTNVIGSVPHVEWLKDMLVYYEKAVFIKDDGSYDMTANSELIARYFETKGLIRNGKEQFINTSLNEVDKFIIHIYDYHYFSPITSTRVIRKNKNTYSVHHCYGSWTDEKPGGIIDSVIIREIINALIKIKRLFIR